MYESLTITPSYVYMSDAPRTDRQVGVAGKGSPAGMIRC